jgi:hypothetical protein
VPDTLTIDQEAVDARKPCAGPLVQPEEAIAIALSTAEWKPKGILDPDGVVVRHVMDGIRLAGWKFEPL